MIKYIADGKILDEVKKFTESNRYVIKIEFGRCLYCDGLYLISGDFDLLYHYVINTSNKLCQCRYKLIFDNDVLSVWRVVKNGELKYIISTDFGWLTVCECDIDIFLDVIQALGCVISEDFVKWLETK
jgi:hypothetical protein